MHGLDDSKFDKKWEIKWDITVGVSLDQLLVRSSRAVACGSM